MSPKLVNTFIDAVIIRVATLADSESLSTLCAQLGYVATPLQIEQRLQRLLQHTDHVIYVAEQQDGAILGCVHAQVCPLLIASTSVVILGLVVDEQARGKGLGKRLLQQIEAWTLNQGYATVLVRSNVIRNEAHRFYEKMGYRLVKQSMVFCKELQMM